MSATLFLSEASKSLQHATAAGDLQEVFRLVGSGGAQLLRDGVFSPKIDRIVPFAQFCVEEGHVPVLAALVESRPSGVTLYDCLEYEEVKGLLSISALYCPVRNALDLANVELVEVLLQAWRSHPLEEDMVRGIEGLHLRALERLLTHNTPDAAARLARMCKLLFAEGIGPVLQEPTFRVANTLCGDTFWHKVAGAIHVPELMRDYAAAGLLSPDEVVDLPVDPGRYRFLTAAIKLGNPILASTLIDMGCDWAKEVRRPYTDLPSTIRALKRPGDAVLAAAVTEALMRARLREMVPPDQAAAVAVPRARRRAL